MYLTNAIILAVELKKLMEGRCYAELHDENYIVAHIGADSDGREGYVDIAVPSLDMCNIKIVVRYAISQEQVAEITAKLKDGDAIRVHDNGISVCREYKMKIRKFDHFSITQVERTAKEIVGRIKSL